jgi:hypothetical protein
MLNEGSVISKFDIPCSLFNIQAVLWFVIKLLPIIVHKIATP